MFVEHVMTAPAVTVGPEAYAEDATALLQEGRFRHLPVVRFGKLVGMVSERDLRVARALTEEPRVGTIAHEDVVTVEPGTPVEDAAVLMLRHKIGALPVVQDGRVIGIVTESDIFRTLITVMGALQPSSRLQLELSDLPRQLADIARITAALNVPIVSLVTEPGGEAGHRIVVLRVGTIESGPLIGAIERYGVRVMEPEGVRS
jgi:acetoin utilization protein AcuB